MKIRLATPDDAEAVADAGGRFYQESGFSERFGAYSPDKIKALIDGPNTGVVVVMDGDALAGMAAGIVVPHWAAESHITGQELFWWVNPDYRGRKVGKLLFEGLEVWVKSMSADSFMMATLHGLDHERNGQIYQRAGYEPLEHVYIKRFD